MSQASSEQHDKKRTNAALFSPDRALPVLALLALLGFALYWFMEPRVFPSASLDLKLSKAEIADISAWYAKKLGYERKSPIASTTFTFSNEPKVFLEYNLGAARANELMKERIPIWSWTTRYCREFDLELFRIWLSPQGKMTAFQRTFEDERPLPSLDHRTALTIARDFLRSYAGVDPDVATLKLVGDKSMTMAHRDDHAFTWQDESEDFKGAHLRYYVYVSGNQVTVYSKTLFVPEKWTRKYGNMRSYNDLLEQVASLFYRPLEYLAYLAVPLALSRRLMRFRVAIFGGLLMAGVAAFDSVNEFSTVVDSYNPTTAFRDYLSSYYLREVLSVLGTFVSGACLFGGADVVYRFAYPKRVALENYLNGTGFATREGVKAVVVGYCVSAMHLGWIIAYYLLGEKLGFWCPLGLDAYQTLGTAFPFFSAISLGVHAAWQEETIARVVALSLMQKLTGKFWLANLFQAAVWGFMHSSYPQQPAYARGIELTIGGLFYGWIMRRYGVLPCVIGHYLVDAFLDVKPLFSADNKALFYSAFVPLLPFVLILLLAIIVLKSSHREPLAEPTVANDSLPVAEPHAEGADELHTPVQYQPLPHKMRVIIGTIAVVCLTYSIFSSPPAPGDQSRIKCTREQAVVKAKAILDANGVDASRYEVVPTLTASLAAGQLQYVFEKVGREKTMALARQVEPGYIWQVRFFRFMDPRQFTVSLYGDGREYDFFVSEDEDAPGARLTAAEAKAKATAFMHRVHPEYKDLVASKVSLDKRKNRNDWTVEFSVPSLKVGEANYKASCSLVGEWVCNFEQSWDVPDSWVQERRKRSTKDVVFGNLRTLVLSVIALLVLWWGWLVLHGGQVRWRVPIIVAALCGGLLFIEQINHLPSFWSEYVTEKTRSTYISEQLLEILKTCSLGVLQNVGYLAFALAAFHALKPGVSMRMVLQTTFRPLNRGAKLVQQNLWTDGLLIALLWEGVYQARSSVSDWLTYWFSPEIEAAKLWSLCSLPGYIAPVASDVVELLPSLVQAVCLYLIAAAIINRFAPRFSHFFILLVIYQAIQSSSARHLADYFIDFSGEIVDKVMLWFIIVRLARFNPVVYVCKIVLDDALPFLYYIGVYAWPCFAPTFASFACYLLAPLVVLVYVRVRNKTEGQRLGSERADGEETIGTASQPPLDGAVTADGLHDVPDIAADNTPSEEPPSDQAL
ncbi:MAG: CPBP family intramembrane metalloprotease [Cyanobacteria bacterium REEB67]|nr:CPBP family intramembrane metalloprotease [Cyanobacteria bacterium REEB67]